MNQVLSVASEKTFQDFDRAWLFEVTSGVQRFRGRIDFIIDTYSLKKKPAGEIRRFLQLAVYQLLAQEVPAPLVVSETVQAVRSHDGEAPSKFANAILRKVADARDQWRSWKVSEQSPHLEQVAWCSLPEWLFKRIRRERGAAWVFEFSESVLQRPELWYRTRNEPLLLNDGLTGREPPGFVQDISNQKLVDSVADWLKKNTATAPRILDLCSAPGGKALGLAFHGFKVEATDLDESRLARVHENVNRLGLQDQILIRAYPEVHESDERFDVIWVDAPCTSTGIVRRHPEIKWNRTLHDVERMALAQEDLRAWTKRHLSPNGILIYSTCSILQAENPTTLQGFECLKTWEWMPQNEPRGDGISAALFKLKES